MQQSTRNAVYKVSCTWDGLLEQIPVPTFSKEVLATRTENKEKLAAVQIMIPTKDSSFLTFQLGFHTHVSEIPRQLMSHSQSKISKGENVCVCNKRIIHSGSSPKHIF